MSNYQEKEQAVARVLRTHRIVPVLAFESVDDALRMGEILVRGGLPVAEVTFRTAVAAEAIKAMTTQFPDLYVGAGTVLNTDDLHRAADAGISFAVAPGFNPVVVQEAIAHGIPFAPGISCPSQIEQGMALGLRLFKFFPAEAAGGTTMLKAMIPPYKHLGIEIMPTGGINPGNLADYLAIPQVVAVGGTWLGKSADMVAGDWRGIEINVCDAVNSLK